MKRQAAHLVACKNESGTHTNIFNGVVVVFFREMQPNAQHTIPLVPQAECIVYDRAHATILCCASKERSYVLFVEFRV